MAAKVAGTWAVIAPAGYGNLDQVDTTQRFPLGTRCRAKDTGATDYGEGEFIYLAGVTSCARGSVVTITTGHVAVLAVARAKGAVAWALGAVDAVTKWGWFQVRGKGVALCDATIADGAPLYIDGTAGRCDDTAVAGDCIIGLIAASADDTNTIVVQAVSTYPATADFDNA